MEYFDLWTAKIDNHLMETIGMNHIEVTFVFSSVNDDENVNENECEKYKTEWNKEWELMEIEAENDCEQISGLRYDANSTFTDLDQIDLMISYEKRRKSQ